MNVTKVTDATGTPTPKAAVEGTTPAQAVVPEKVEKTEDDKRFAEMAKKEKFLRFQQKKLQDEKAAIAAEKAALQAMKQPQTQDTSWKDKLAADPIGFMTEQGYTYDQITEKLLNQNPQDSVLRGLQKEIEELKKAHADSITKQKEASTQQIEQAMKQLRNEAKMLVQGNEEYALIEQNNAQDQVASLIKKTFDETGFIMDVEEAAKEVEEYLVEKALKIAQLKKVQDKLAPKAPETTQTLTTTPKPTTLTHSVTTQSKPASSKERRERAIAAFHGKLG
jgi:hypothetical protein